jgi:hypothetical protein
VNARLDARDRILCAIRDCGTPVGLMLEDETGDRLAALPIGWRPQAGVWQPTPHAIRHRAAYGTYKNRSTPKFADTASMKRGRKMVRVYPMPARVKCPACGMVQVLDPEALRFSSRWRPGRVVGGDGRGGDPPLVVIPREIAEAKGF